MTVEARASNNLAEDNVLTSIVPFNQYSTQHRDSIL
jgi:hypothetical protein